MKKFFLIIVGSILVGSFVFGQKYLSESFEGAWSGTPATPSGWSNIHTTATGGTTGIDPIYWAKNSWSGSAWSPAGAGTPTTPTGAYDGTSVAWYNNTGATGAKATQKDQLNTSVIDLSSSSYSVISFYLACSNTILTPYPLILKVRGFDGTTWNDIQTISKPGSDWTKISVPVPAIYNFNGAQFGIEVTASNTFGDVWLDKFSIDEVVFAPLSGIKTIGVEYATLALAIKALNESGVSGPVTINVPGGYTETFASRHDGLITATGTAANPIIFQKSGGGANPVITAAVGATTNLDGIIKLAGSDYITFDGIDLAENAANVTQLTRMEFGYGFFKERNVAPFNGCQNIVIKNCTITLNKATPTTTCTGIYSGDHLASSVPLIDLTGGSTSDAMNNCQFFSNNITNVTNGIALNGWNNAPVPFDMFDQNIEIGVGGANIITNFNSNGINPRYMKAVKVANNNISSTTATPVSGLNGIIVQNTSNYDVYNNTVSLTPTAGNISLQGITVQTGDAAFTSSIYNNTVQNSTNALATSAGFTGISCTGAPGTLNFYSNTVTNNTIPGTGGFTGIDTPGSGGIVNLYNNTVSNNTKTGTSGAFVGMRVAAAGAVNAYGNNIFSNFNTTTAGAAQGGTMTGISCTNGNPAKVYQNRVYNISTAGVSSSATVNGITIANGTNMNVYNNFVSDLRSPAASGTLTNWVNSIAGINVSGGTNVNVYFNTVYLNAASTGTYFTTSALYASTTPTLDLRNNILVNKSTINSGNYLGYVLAYRRSNATLTSYSNNSNSNDFFVYEPEENFNCGTFWNTDYLVGPYLFTDYLTLVGPARDANSFLELPPFQDIAAPSPPPTPYNLHLINGATTLCESGGLQITSPIIITDDFDGNTRAALPDVGADEFNGVFTGVLNPSGVYTTVISSSQVNVAFTPNPTPNNIVIVWNTTGTFTTPSGTPPPVNSDFAGGKVLSNDQSSPAIHTGLAGATTYYYKAFSYDGVSSYSNGVTVSAITNIAPPTAFTATAFSATQINLTWTKNAFDNDVIIAYNTTNTFGQPVNGTAYPLGSTLPTAGNVIYVGPLSAFNQTTGLNPFTAYFYKAWSVDQANNNVYSPTGVTANATTLCSSYTVPFTEGFESGTVGCGTIVDQNNDFSTWAAYYNVGQAHSGGNTIRVTGNNPTTDDWYFTNGLSLTGGVSYTVQFWTKISSAIGPQNLEVKWGSSPTVAGMTSPAIYTITGYASTTYTQVTCSLTPASTGIYNIGWHCFSGPYTNSFLYVDDISVYDPLFANWTGAVSSDWANAGNWLPNSIPGASSAVYIPGGITNYPTIAAPASCSSITIASGASLLDNGNLTVSGTATVNRNYTGGEWHLISSPISNATANMFLDLYLQKHTESSNVYTDITLPTTPLNVMQGYALWNDLAGTASFVGALNTGNIGASNNLTRNGQGWNLAGNPYPSPIDWDAALGWTKINVDNATYRHVNSAIWASYVGGVGANGGSRYIPSCQGFFVGVTSGFTIGTLNMTNAVRTHSTSTFFKDEVSDILRLEVTGNGYTDETVIRFLDVATSDFDGQWDAHKLFGIVSEAPAIYSVDNGMMAINSLPSTNTVPVGIKAGVPGEFTITATETSEFGDVNLEDLLTGAITDLKNNFYTFNYDMSFDNRFIVHFTPLAVGENPVNLINIYSSQKDVYVSVPANTKGDIVVYNLMGQEVARSIIQGVNNKITLNKSAYYVVKVVSNEDVVTKKVFVQ
jgi:hypothetical protein